MAGPIQTEIVVVTAGSHYEVKISVADGAMTAARFVERITGVAPRRLLVDGFPVPGEQPMMEVPLVRGSHLEVADDANGEPLCTLVGLIGEAAAEVIHLSAGVHQIGCVDVDVQARGNQGGAACLYVDVDGAAWIDPVDAEVMIDGAPVTSMTSLSPGNEVRIGRQSYRFGRVVDRSRGKRRIAFNRPPRSQFPASLPLLVAPSAPPEALQPMRFGWGALLIPVLLGGVMALVWNPMMAIFALLSPAMMLANWYEDKRRAGRANEEAAADVLQAMTVFRRRFTALFDAARGLAWRGSPGPAELLERLVAGDSRMWEPPRPH